MATYISWKWAYFWILRFLIKKFKIFSIRFRRSGLYRRRTKDPFFHNGKIFHLCAKMRVSSTDRDIYSVLFRIKKKILIFRWSTMIWKYQKSQKWTFKNSRNFQISRWKFLIYQKKMKFSKIQRDRQHFHSKLTKFHQNWPNFHQNGPLRAKNWPF